MIIPVDWNFSSGWTIPYVISEQRL
jgi:hypothetical protein